MLGRRKQTQDTPTATTVHEDRPGAKNRPTPSRKEQEAARRRPLVGADRGRATKEAREAARVDRMKAREAMMAGDEKYLAPRDKGPVRRFVRDYVDARINVGEFLLPVMLLVLLGSFVNQTRVVGVVLFLAMYTLVALSVVDGLVLSLRLKKRLREKFGEDQIARGTVTYGVMRSFQLRRSRVPRVQVKRREYPS